MLLKARKTNKETKNACAPVSSGEPSSTGQKNPQNSTKKYPNCALKTSSQALSGHNSNTASIHLYSNSQKQRTEAGSCHPPLTSTLLTTDGEQVRLSPEREHI